MLVVAVLFKPRAYTVAYYVLTLSADILVFFVAHEIYSKVFGPRNALPSFVPERTATMMAVSFTAAVSLSLILRATEVWFKWLLTTEQTLTAAAFATFWILFTYSKTLRIKWPKRASEIWTGFALYLTISVIAVFIRARAASPVAIAADRTAQISYLLAAVWWGWRLREEDEIAVAMTSEQVGEMREHHERTMDEMRKAGIL